MSNRQYFCFVEHNDCEGETWNIYFPFDTNSEAMNEIQSLLDSVGDDEEYAYDIDEEFEISEDLIDESEVDVLVKHSRGGWANFYQKCDGTIDLATIKKIKKKNHEAFVWAFYKLGILDMLR